MKALGVHRNQEACCEIPQKVNKEIMLNKKAGCSVFFLSPGLKDDLEVILCTWTDRTLIFHHSESEGG